MGVVGFGAGSAVGRPGADGSQLRAGRSHGTDVVVRGLPFETLRVLTS